MVATKFQAGAFAVLSGVVSEVLDRLKSEKSDEPMRLVKYGGNVLAMYSQGNASPIPDNSLSLYLRMVEGANNTVYDYSGGGRHGKLSGASWGVIGALFNATGEYIEVPDSVALRVGTGDFSIFMSVKQNAVNENNEVIVAKNSTTNDGTEWGILVNNGNFQFWSEVALTQTTNSYNTSNWTSVLLVKNGADAIWYVNGVLDRIHVGGFQLVGTWNSSKNLLIGSEVGSQNPFNGEIKTIILWKVALPAYPVGLM